MIEIEGGHLHLKAAETAVLGKATIQPSPIEHSTNHTGKCFVELMGGGCGATSGVGIMLRQGRSPTSDQRQCIAEQMKRETSHGSDAGEELEELGQTRQPDRSKLSTPLMPID